MILYLIGHPYKYECEKICRIYFPAEKIVFAADGENAGDDARTVRAEMKPDGANTVFLCEADIDGRHALYAFAAQTPRGGDENAVNSACERLLAKAMVKALTRITGITPPWGILTGVRPSKLMRKYIAELGEAEARRRFTGLLEVTPEKTELAFNVAQAENACVALSGNNSFSLYVSIPFCPTRCSYCSFVSHSIEQAKKLIPDYVRLLCREIEDTARIAARIGLKLETVYIGGGTPTSLDARSLRRITDALNASFDMKSVREFTVEAGRPDTIDREKLAVLKNAGVTRISINPQTFSDEVLERIGRRHSAADIYEKFELARETGFDNINMDLIAGLPGDTPVGFRESLLAAVGLAPENITVHTLALKRSSTLVTEEETDSVCRATSEMLDFARETLYGAGYSPYYMYRQSKSVGNLENVGWSKKGKDCLYNVYMMEEIHTVLAVGGGAVSRLVSPVDGAIERVYNFKYPYEYVGRFDEQNARKDAFAEFYKAHT